MPPVGFEPIISADERPQTYALDRAATGTGKGTAIPVQSWTDPDSSRKVRLPYQHMKVVSLSSYVPATFIPMEYSWYSFLLEAESNPGS